MITNTRRSILSAFHLVEFFVSDLETFLLLVVFIFHLYFMRHSVAGKTERLSGAANAALLSLPLSFSYLTRGRFGKSKIQKV